MFLIWCGPDREDICDSFELKEDEMYDIELYCEPICNFSATIYKFCQVSKREHEMTNAFYYHIQKFCVQCQFSEDKECLVYAIIFSSRVHKAREAVTDAQTFNLA